MKHKNILKGGLLAFLIMATATTAFTDPVTGDVLYINDQGIYRRFWMDTTQNGIEDSYIIVDTGLSDGSLLSRYIRQGGKVVFDKRNDGGMSHSQRVIISIIMPDSPETPENLRGKQFNIFDLFPNVSDQTFPYAQRDGQR
jgi:hypothetical protein